MLTVDDANEAKCERKPEMNHPAVSVAFVCVCASWCVRLRPDQQPAVYAVQSSV